MVEEKRYNTQLLADEQRRGDYNNLCSLLSSWEQEYTDLQKVLANSDTDEAADDSDYAINSISVKASVAKTHYINAYSRFKLMDVVQVVENNRVANIGEIRIIDVLVDPKSAESAKKLVAKRVQKDRFGRSDDIWHYTEDEFVYQIHCPVSCREHSTYRQVSPLAIYKKPARMISTCPLCGVQNKPMTEAVIGGEVVVLCVDCHAILLDMAGREYVEKTLRFDDIKNLNIYDHIHALSGAR